MVKESRRETECNGLSRTRERNGEGERKREEERPVWSICQT